MELIPAREVPQILWPEILHHKHNDYIWPFSTIGRSATAWFGEPPKKIEGNAEEFDFLYYFNGFFWRPPQTPAEVLESKIFKHPFPIPAPGQWWRGSPDFYAKKYKNGVYIRYGYRWDNVDGYYQKPSFTIKKYEIIE